MHGVDVSLPRPLAVLLVPLVGAAAAGAEQTRFTLRASAPAGAAQRPAWLASGLPFARGALRDPEALRLTDEDGAPVPLQTRRLATWPDGSLRWCQAIFPADLTAARTRTFEVSWDGRSPRPPPGKLALSESGGAVDVDNGRVKVRLDRSGPSASSVVVGSVRAPWPVTVLHMDGGEHRSDRAAPDELVVESRGPLAAEIRVGAWCVGPGGEKWVRVLCRLRVCAGSNTIRVLHTLLWLDGPELPRVARIALEWPGGAPIDAARIDRAPAAAPPVALAPVGGAALEGNRYAPPGYRLTAGGAVSDVDKPTGAFAWTRAGVRTTVCTRHFWRQGPKAIEVDRESARLVLLAAEDAPLPIGRTRAKSHDLQITFEASGDPGEPGDQGKAWDAPPLAIVDPEYLCRTEALAVLSPVSRDFWGEFEGAVDKSLEAWLKEAHSDPHYTGLMNFGDAPLASGAYGHKGVAYVDQEYDLTHTLLQLYARSGDRRCFEWGEAAARHFMDVDVDQVQGHNRFHGYRDRCESHQAVTTGCEWGHVMCDGLIDYFYLTGDRRALEKARGIGDVCCGLGRTADFAKPRSVFKGAERNLGWPLLTLMRVYEATLEEKYRAAADNMVAYLNHYAADPLAEMRCGTWWRSWMIDGCKVFMTGLLHEGLDRHHELTSDPQTKRSILTSLDWVIDNMWREDMETFMYEFNAYNRGHRDKFPVHLNFMAVHAFGYGFRISGDQRYLDVGLRALRSAVDDMAGPSKFGKEFAMQLRSTLQLVGHLYRARHDFTWPAPPEARPGEASEIVPADRFPALPRDPETVLLRGAAPSAQSGDLAIRPRQFSLDGKVLTSWEEAGSWAEWEAPVREAGSYVLLLRYAAADTARRGVVVDGADAGDVALEGTGGWGQAPEEFDYALASDGGRARLFALAPGDHKVRLTHGQAGIALDFAALVKVPAGASIPAGPGPSQRPRAEELLRISFDADDPKVAFHRYASPGNSQPQIGLPVTDPYRAADDGNGFETALNFGAHRGQARGICQYLKPERDLPLRGLQYDVHPGGTLPAYTVYLVEAPDTSVAGLRAAKTLAAWRDLGDAAVPGVKELSVADAVPGVREIVLRQAATYGVLFVHDPGGDREPHVCAIDPAAAVSVRADRSGTAKLPLRWYSGGQWGEWPWVVWLAAVGPKIPEPKLPFVDGVAGKALVLNRECWASVDVPQDFLSRAGGVSVRLRPTWELTPSSPNQRALLHIQGARPFRNALTICTIYNEIRVRLYDARGHLCGTLEADAAHWQANEWRQVALTWDAGALRLDLEGKAAARSARVRLPEGPVGVCWLGWRPGNWFLNAAVDEVVLSRGWLPAP